MSNSGQELVLLNSCHWVYSVWRSEKKSHYPVGLFKSRILARDKRRMEKRNGYNGHIVCLLIGEVFRTRKRREFGFSFQNDS